MFPINVCGTLYPYPDVGEDPWGIEHIQWAIAVSQCVSANNTAIQNIIAGGTFSNPMTNNGDIIYQNLGLPDRLGIGFDGQVLTSQGGVPVWENPTGGVTPIYVFSATSANFSTTSPTYVDVLTASITSDGNPVEIKLQDDNTGLSTINILSLGALAGLAEVITDIQITRDGTPISQIPLRAWIDTFAAPPKYSQYIPTSSICFTDDVPAGTHEYKLQAKTLLPDFQIDIFYTKMVLKTYV